MSLYSNPILVVDDSDEDFTALARVFRKCELRNPVVRCQDGDDALEYLLGLGQHVDWPALLPAIILLDLNMPGTDGRAVLDVLKKNPRLQAIPVIIFSTSSSTRDIEECYQLGANSYLTKPIVYAELEEKVRLAMRYWLDAAELPSVNPQAG